MGHGLGIQTSKVIPLLHEYEGGEHEPAHPEPGADPAVAFAPVSRP